MGAPQRTARGDGVAWAGVDLELAATDTGSVIEAKKVFSRSSVTETEVHLTWSSPRILAQQVVGHSVAAYQAPCSFIRIKGRLGMAEPDRQELVALDGLQKHDRLLTDHVEADAVEMTISCTLKSSERGKGQSIGTRRSPARRR